MNFTLFYYLAVIGVIDSTLKMMIQIDSKVVIAFSTTVQMNLICFIVFSLTTESLDTLKLGLVNHLLTASILFFFADQILVRFNTREFFFLSGLYYFLPFMSVNLTLFIINQINFPGFLGFFLDVYFLSTTLALYTGTSFFLFFFLFVIEHLYILFFFLKILYGVSTKFNHVLSGLYYFLPFMSVNLTLFIINQINFPGFLGFFLDVYFLSTTLALYTGTSFFLFFFLFVIEHLYILFFFLKILYGVSTKFNHVIFKDLSYDETLLSLFLLGISFFFGMFPLTLSVLFI